MFIENLIQTRPVRAAFEPSDRFIAGRDLPPGTLGWHVDCAANPMDLRPAVETIIHAIDETRAKTPPEKPLMVLFGEVHSVPAHGHLLPFVANRLHARGENLVVAQERPFNLWAEATAYAMEPSVPKDLLRQPSCLYDETGRGAVLAALGYVQTAMAPVSTDNELAFFQEKGLKVVFNDAARIPFSRELDLENPVIARAIQAQGRQDPLPDEAHATLRSVLVACNRWYSEWKRARAKRNSTSPEGMAIRNAVMTDLAVDFAGRHKAPVILQQTGLAHLFGNAADGCAYPDSLHAMATRRGVEVLSVFPTHPNCKYGLNLPPSGAQRALKDTVVIDGLAQDEFEHGSMGSELEEVHLWEMLDASGNEIPFYDVNKNLYDRQGQAEQEARQILDTYHARQASRTPTGREVEKPLAFGS